MSPRKRATTTKTLDSFVSRSDNRKKPKLSSTSVSSEWQTYCNDSIIARGTLGDCTPTTKIAGFDMDGTLIQPKSGKAHPLNRNDWKFWNPSVPRTLQRLVSDGYKILVISNQQGIEKGKVTKEEIMGKIDDVFEELDPIVKEHSLWAIVPNESIYRKPCTGVWEWAVGGDDGRFDKDNSFYCGDAAGRPAKKPIRPKKDFSAGDYKFALNLGIRFDLPESMFGNNPSSLNDIPKLGNGEFDPTTLSKTNSSSSTFLETLQSSLFEEASGQKELILMVGAPGSGKSTIAQTAFPEHYVRINQDTLKTIAKCHNAAKKALQSGKSAVIDNQNKEKSKRADYIKIAQAANADRIRCVYFDVPKDFCFHMNAVRARDDSSDRKKVPSMVIHSFYKYVEKPVVGKEAGISEVITYSLMDFVLLGSEENKKYVTMWQL